MGGFSSARPRRSVLKVQVRLKIRHRHAFARTLGFLRRRGWAVGYCADLQDVVQREAVQPVETEDNLKVTDQPRMTSLMNALLGTWASRTGGCLNCRKLPGWRPRNYTRSLETMCVVSSHHGTIRLFVDSQSEFFLFSRHPDFAIDPECFGHSFS